MDEVSASATATVFTIGHSNHPIETFCRLLTQHGIALVVDVRSMPYCGYAAHFNREVFRRSLKDAGIQYLFLGEALGGMPQSEEFYDQEHHVLYEKLAASPAFQDGIRRVLELGRAERIALLCGEEDPTHCHRRLLVGSVLRRHGATLFHIRGDGRVQTEDDVAREEDGGQGELFDLEEIQAWKSTRSVAPKEPPKTSSRP